MPIPQPSKSLINMSSGTYKLKTVNVSAPPIITAAILTAGLFLLLPLTQYFQGGGNDDKEIRQVAITPPPPPIDFEDQPPIEEPPPEVEVQQLESPPPEISLSTLNASLAVGSGAGSVAVDMDDFDTEVNAVEQMFFSLAELDRVPKRISGRAPEYPYELKRNRIEGDVMLLVEIDERGRVKVIEVLSSDNRAFEKPAIESAESCVFEKPMKDGKAVRTRFQFPLKFSLKS